MRLCTICARGGSEGVPGKNIRELAGVPLIGHSIQRAKDSGLFDCVAVDSDSDEILDTADRLGADLVLKRPAELATATAGKLGAIERAVRQVETIRGVEYSTLVDLDVTSPLRSVTDIAGAVDLLESSGAANVISVTPAHRSPYFNLVEESADGVVMLSKPSDVIRRQDSPACFDMNASIYVWSREGFFPEPKLFVDTTRAFVMPRERSVDVDDELDFRIVEMLMGDAR